MLFNLSLSYFTVIDDATCPFRSRGVVETRRVAAAGGFNLMPAGGCDAKFNLRLFCQFTYCIITIQTQTIAAI